MLGTEAPLEKEPEKPLEKELCADSTMDVEKESDATAKNYNHYFSTGIYKQRYPRVNRHTLAFINYYANKKPADLSMLDYGCGNGRYLIKLLFCHLNAHFIAYDISSTPLQILRETLLSIKQSARVSIVDNVELLDNTSSPYDHDKPLHCDIALLLFGVLSHVPSSVERQKILTCLREKIAPKSGHLLLSVPNKKRRFAAMQKQQNSYEITYSRNIDNQVTDFYYHLYDTGTIRTELNNANLEVINIRAESLLPESWVTRMPIIGWLDQQLCQFIPACWGYGLLICCRAKTEKK
jgi:2-polyprenyl-3-methyl-5-hydroxy-6-metoxy-1,4-benzoquinol methylase